MEKITKNERSTFERLGGVEGVRTLANCFYGIMDSMPEARKIREMHPRNIEVTCENFTLFLCGWLGGPPLYKEKYGSLNLTGLHALLKINESERDMWLLCMEQAIEQQDIEDDLKKELIARFRVPAEKIYNWCQQQFLQSSNLSNQPKVKIS